MKSRQPIRHSFTRRLYARFVVSPASNERGATAALVAVSILMMLGMVSLAVDMGMLLGARTDSQRVADAAALAGAASFITAPDDSDRPRQWAIDYATRNRVHSTIADVRPEDVDVLVAEQKVRVRVRNITERGNAIRTIFARVLGWDEVNIGTIAAAEAVSAGAGICPLPIALPDRWVDNPNGPNPNNQRFDPSDNDKYEPFEPAKPKENQCPAWANCGVPPGQVHQQYTGPEFTGFLGDEVATNLGAVLEVKTQSGPPNKSGGPSGQLVLPGGLESYNASPCVDASSWNCWYLPDGGSGGASNLGDWVDGCPDPDKKVTLAAGDWIEPHPGIVQSQVLQAFRELVAYYGGDGWEWDSTHECMSNGVGSATNCMHNVDPLAFEKRHRAIPVIDPSTTPDNQDPAQIIRWECVFIEKVAETYYLANSSTPTPNGHGSPGRYNVYVRFTRCSDGMVPGPGTGSTLKTLRLVE
jgi:Flp pilus assembly protein TadG